MESCPTNVAAEMVGWGVDPQGSSQRPKKVPGGPPRDEDRPTLAQSATLAADLGESESKRVWPVTVSGGRTGVKRGKYRLVNPNPQHKNQVIWKRKYHGERAQVIWIRMLLPGMILVREYKQQIYRILVMRHSYQDLATKKKYPTLVALTEAITGRPLSKYNQFLSQAKATRFWNLKRIMLTRPTFHVPRLYGS